MKKFLFAALSVLTASLSLAAVNINTASPSELEALPGIGPAKAKAHCGLPPAAWCLQIGGRAQKR